MNDKTSRPHGDCLDDDRILLLLEGKLTPTDRTAAEAHLDACETCQRLVGAAAPSEDASSRHVSDTGRGVAVGRYLILSLLGQGGMGRVYAAYDPDLDRRVALKLLHRATGSGDARQRMAREARSLGKLSHPNVVQVYDVGEHEGEVFIAMELVDGEPLNEFLQRAPKPSWRQVLAAFLDAARGISAAHQKGLVHRDVKPSNILRGKDGRVRVADFGLATGRERDDLVPTVTPTPSDATMQLAETLPVAQGYEGAATANGAIVGTPLYMAPEQHEGGRATAASDQYGLCVALYEGLFGKLPFTIEHGPLRMMNARLLEAKNAGPPSAPPAGTPVPRWVFKALVRGLAPTPQERYPSLDALIAVLEDDPDVRRRSRRRNIAVGTIVAGFVVAGFAFMTKSGTFRDPCAHPERQLAGVWDDDVKERVRRAFLGAGRSYAEDTTGRVFARLDAYSAEWAAMRGEVCAAARTEGHRESLDLRDMCLDRRRDQLRALATLLAEKPDADVLDKASQMAAGLYPVTYCRDTEALLARVRPPEDPVLRARVASLQPRVDRVETLLDAGKFKEGLALGEPLLSEMAELPYAPLRAQMETVVGRLRDDAGDHEGAKAMLRRAVVSAAEGRDDELAVAAWGHLLFVVGVGQRRMDEAAVILALGQTAVVRTHDARTQASWLNVEGAVLNSMGKHAEAKVAHERALGLREKALGPDHPDTAVSMNNLGIVLCSMGNCREAKTFFERSVAVSEKCQGPDHPGTAASLTNLGNALRRVGDFEGALTVQRRVLAIREKTLPADHPNIASSLNNLGNVLFETGNYTEALAVHRRALAIREKALPAEHPNIAKSLSNMGNALFETGNDAGALAAHRRALLIHEKALGPDHPDLAGALVGMGRAMVRSGQLDEALSTLERARILREKKLGPAHPELAGVLLGLGEVSLARGVPADALPMLERAIELDSAEFGGEIQLTVAEVLWRIGKDRVRARALADESRTIYERRGHRPGRERASRWLIEHVIP